MPLYIDFLSKKMRYRQQHATLKNEYLARALGLKKDMRDKIKIIDATGGLANDAFILASLGFSATILERSKVIYDLIADAIQRAQACPEIAPVIQRLDLIHANSVDFIKNIPTKEQPDLIYIDPMFPERKKSALVKKDMRMLQTVVGYDEDAGNLLETALTCAKKRVVVKRPRLAPPLTTANNTTPHFCLEGSSSRFDVYLIA